MSGLRWDLTFENGGWMLHLSERGRTEISNENQSPAQSHQNENKTQTPQTKFHRIQLQNTHTDL